MIKENQIGNVRKIAQKLEEEKFGVYRKEGSQDFFEIDEDALRQRCGDIGIDEKDVEVAMLSESVLTTWMRSKRPKTTKIHWF